MKISVKISIGFIIITFALAAIFTISISLSDELVEYKDDINSNIENTNRNYQKFVSFSRLRTLTSDIFQNILFLGNIDNIDELPDFSLTFEGNMNELSLHLRNYKFGDSVLEIFSSLDRQIIELLKLKQDELKSKKELANITAGSFLSSRQIKIKKQKKELKKFQRTRIKKVRKFVSRYKELEKKQKLTIKSLRALGLYGFSLYDIEMLWSSSAIKSSENFPEFLEIKFYTREIIASSGNILNFKKLIRSKKEIILQNALSLKAFSLISNSEYLLIQESLRAYSKELNSLVKIVKSIKTIEQQLNSTMLIVEDLQTRITNSRKKSLLIINNDIKAALLNLESRLTLISIESEEIMLKSFKSVSLIIEKSNTTLKSSNLHTLSLIIFSIVVLIILFYFIFYRVIIHPLNYLKDTMNEVTRGHFNKKVVIKTKDEIGELAKTFNDMTANINTNFNEIEQLKNFLSGILESMPSVLIVISDKGEILQWNKAAENLTNIESIDAVGKNLWDLLPEFGKYHDLASEVMLSEKAEDLFMEKFYTRPISYQNISLYPVRASGSTNLVFRMDDVTELEKKDIQLRQAQKMETVGTLAGGLAHDFNNVLGGIVGTLSVFRFKLKKWKNQVDVNKLNDFLDTIEISGNRAADMVKQLLTLSRKQEVAFAPVDLNMTMKHVLKICKNSLDKTVNLNFKFASEKAMITADPTQIEQVLLNLCVNASHAMTIMRAKDEHSGGTLAVSLENILADEKFIAIHPQAKSASYWKLTCKDTGIGMDEKIISRIFDPFFTTKQKGVGTGLGLSMVYGIIETHKGFLELESDLGKGTTFTIYLPIETGSGNVLSKISEESNPTGDGLILIVDDEPLMRSLAKDILENSGYSVLMAKDGIEGVDIFKKHYQKIELVLLDLVMPKMSGNEAYSEMKKIDPDLKVLLASGFVKDYRVEEIINEGAQAFLQKPYTFGRLAKAVYDVIESE